MTRAPRTAEQLDSRVTARRHRDALRRRTRRIRRSVAGLALALFAAAFLIVYVQLASGHDPALVANAERRAAATSAGGTSSTASSTQSTDGEASTSGESSTSTESTTSSGSTSGEGSGESSSSTGGKSSASASAVTTSQS